MNQMLIILSIMLFITISILIFYINKYKCQSLKIKRCINLLDENEIEVDKFDVFNVWDVYDKKVVKAIAILKEGNKYGRN